MTADDAQEIKSLLRDIRDQQKAHFEQYAAFVEQAVQSQRLAADESATARAEEKAHLREQRAYQEEMRSAVQASQRQALIGLAIVFGFIFISIGAYAVLNAILSNMGIKL